MLFTIFSRTWLRYVQLTNPPSVICNIVAPQAERNFLAIFLHRLIAEGLGQFVSKFWAKIWRSPRESCKLNTTWYEKLAFSTNISLYFDNGARYGQLQWKMNSKSYAIYWMVPFPMTLSDPLTYISRSWYFER